MAQWITELTQRIECLAAKTRFVYRLASGYYRSVVDKEICLAKITDNDHILCIGGGICPFSAILLHQSTGAKVTVIDNNVQCFNRARQVIDSLGLGGSISVLCKDGGSKDLSLSGYTVVHFAMQVYPMEAVFSHIEKRVSPGTKLLVRRPKRFIGSMYSQLQSTMLECYRHITHNRICNIGSTLLYVKQGARLRQSREAIA